MLHYSCMLTSVAVQVLCIAGRASWPVKVARKVHRSWESLPDLIGSDVAMRCMQASARAINLQPGEEAVSKRYRAVSSCLLGIRL